MKLALKIIFALNILLFIAAAVCNYIKHPMYPILMGIGVIYMALILMPFFLFFRYDHKQQLKAKLEAQQEQEQEPKDPIA